MHQIDSDHPLRELSETPLKPGIERIAYRLYRVIPAYPASPRAPRETVRTLQ